MINYKDFPEGKPMNSLPHLGWDPMASSDARWNAVLRDIYNDVNKVNIFGPMGPAEMEQFCAHLAVPFPGSDLKVDGESKNIWGFVMHFIHWKNLKDQSGIDERFSKKGYPYVVTRNDKTKDPVTGTITDKVSELILA